MPFQKILQAIFFGLLQGITEFLPISSSGHLVLFQHLFGIEEPELFFFVVLHIATMTATITFFRKDLREIIDSAIKRERSGLGFLLNICIALIPTMIIGFVVAKQFAYTFASLKVVSIAILGTALILIVPSFFSFRSMEEVTKGKAFVIGAAQGISVIPGFSRSGWTIMTGVISGIDFRESFRFSFLLSIPAIFGAMVLNIHEGSFQTTFPFPAIASGFIAAFFSGYASLGILKKTIGKMKIHLFGYYLLGLFLITLLLNR